MLKCLLSLILSILFVSNVSAQTKSDTLLYYVKNDGNIVSDKSEADFILFIMPKNPDNNLYPVLQYYPNGKRKLIASSSNNSLIDLNLEGPFMAFFPSGKRQISTTYKNGQPTGDEITYYPNGNVYTERKLFKNKILMIECRDSTGTVLAANENGKWRKFSSDFKILLSEGKVVTGVKDGEWNGYEGRRVYKKGDLIWGNDHTGEIIYSYFYDSTNPGIISSQYVPLNLMFKDDHQIVKPVGTNVDITLGTSLSDTANLFAFVEIPPSYPGGIDALYKSFANSINYPYSDRINEIQGNVFVSFTIEKDGTLSEFKVKSAPSKSLGEEALRVVKLSKKWIPGMQDGNPVRVQFTVPITFTLN